MTHSEMVDCGIDFDYEETIREGDEYLWEEDEEPEEGDEDRGLDEYWESQYDLEEGFNPYEGCYDFDC